MLQHGRSAAVLDAVAGVPLGAADLRLVLTGCTAASARPEARALGADWRVITEASGDALYLHRAAAQPWQLVAVVRSPWRAEYRDHVDGLPRTIRIVSAARDAAAGAAFDVTLAVSQVDTNVPLGPEVFRVDIPRTAQPITLDELRHARPGVREN